MTNMTPEQMRAAEIQGLEAQFRNNLKLIERRDMVEKLERNPTFRKLILEFFCVEQCAVYAQLSADPALKPEAQKDSLALAQAAGHLRRFLHVTKQMGNQAEAQQDSIRAAIDSTPDEDETETEDTETEE